METLNIENIEEIRRREGIDDVELRAEIRALKIGDVVKLTVLTGATSFEYLLVRITGIKGAAFRGVLARNPHTSILSNLRAGSPIEFTAAQIHSLPRREEQT